MRIKITADSTCDLSEQLLSEHEITLMPLVVNMGAESFLDGVSIQPGDIFSHVDRGGALCTTSARNPDEYRALFAPFAKDYDAVVHISIGSGFSVSYQNACLAAAEFENVRVLDSQNLSTGQGHIVLEACRLAEGCQDVEKMMDELIELTGRVETSFLLDRLDYMVKGGRCSAVAALGANLLKLKPCIEVAGGRMRVCKKYRGSYEHCIASYVQERIGQARTDLVRQRLFITHTPVTDSILQTVRETVDACPAFAEVCETQAGCTVSCHCGPGTLGVLFIREA